MKMLEKWSCTKVTGEWGGVQKSFPRTDPKGGRDSGLNEFRLLRKEIKVCLHQRP